MTFTHAGVASIVELIAATPGSGSGAPCPAMQEIGRSRGANGPVGLLETPVPMQRLLVSPRITAA